MKCVGLGTYFFLILSLSTLFVIGCGVRWLEPGPSVLSQGQGVSLECRMGFDRMTKGENLYLLFGQQSE